MLSKHELLREINEEIVVLHEFDDALVGYIERSYGPVVAVYDTEQVLRALMDADDMTAEEAHEYFCYNILGSYQGEHTPVFMTFFEEGK